jgi:hypothetical protein
VAIEAVTYPPLSEWDSDTDRRPNDELLTTLQVAHRLPEQQAARSPPHQLVGLVPLVDAGEGKLEEG